MRKTMTLLVAVILLLSAFNLNVPAQEAETQVNLIQGYYYLSTSRRESENFSVTEPIKLNKGDKITWSVNTSVTSSVNLPALVKMANSSSAAPGGGLVGGKAGYQTYEYVATEDIYVAFSVKNADGYKCEIIKGANVEQAVPQLNQTSGNADAENQSDNTEPAATEKSVEDLAMDISYENGYIMSSSGAVADATNARVSTLFSLKKGEVIEFTARGYNKGTVSVLHEYDQYGIALQPILVPTNDEYEKHYYVEQKDMGYYRVSSFGIVQELNVIKTASLQVLIDEYANSRADSYEHYKLLFEKAIFIGDSLTKGVLGTTNSTNAKISFPYYIGKLTGWEITNAGHPSYTTQQFLENDLKTLDFTDKDICFIYLGQNGGFTDGSDTDVQATAYCNIIEYIKEQNPNIHIFMLVGGGSNATVVLPMIAEKYDLPCLDIYRNQYFTILKNLDYHPYKADGVSRDLVHLGRIGYLDLAKSVLNMTFDYIHENKGEFEYPYP